MKLCTICKIRPRKNHGRQFYCLKCYSEYMRKWRANHPLKGDAYRCMVARAYANVYLKRGKIQVESCKVCGDKAQMHHPDYSKPLEIIWLCRKHHLDLHYQRHPVKT